MAQHLGPRTYAGGHAADLGRGGPVAANDAPWRAHQIAGSAPGRSPRFRPTTPCRRSDSRSVRLVAGCLSRCRAVRAIGGHSLRRACGEACGAENRCRAASSDRPSNGAPEIRQGLATRTHEDQGIGPCWPNRPTLKVRRDPPSGERLPPSFRARILKVRTEIPAEPAPFSAGHRCGECCERPTGAAIGTGERRSLGGRLKRTSAAPGRKTAQKQPSPDGSALVIGAGNGYEARCHLHRKETAPAGVAFSRRRQQTDERMETSF